MDLTLETVATLALVLGIVISVLVNDNWRRGVFFILGAGFLQDSFRKLVEGEPVAISAAVAVLTLLVWGIGLNQFRGNPEEMGLSRHYPSIGKAFVVFGGVVLFQSMLTIVNFGSIALAGIGLLAYLSPLPGIWVGWWYCRTEEDLFQLLRLYASFGVLVAIGVYLSWSGTDWVILKQVGEAMIIYDDILGLVETHSGFMRAPEVAAWHLGAAACFLIVLATTRPNLSRTIMFSLAIAVILPAIYLTGRRKALAMIGLFVGIFVILLQFSRNRDARSASIALIGLAVGILSMLFYLTDDTSEDSPYRPYTARASTVYGDAWERFSELGLGSIGMAIYRVGFFGLGTGVVSQGGQHFGVDAELAGAAEGGLGKIIVELGIPGLIVLVWVLYVIARTIRSQLTLAQSSGGAGATVMLALISFLMVNIVLFVTASQVFGDPFVLVLLGMIFGSVLAIPPMWNRQHEDDSGGLRPEDFADRLREARFRELRR